MTSPAQEEAGATDSGTSPSRCNLHKAFKSLKSHASAVANFTLQWEDLEVHILSLQHQLDSMLAPLQSQAAAQPEPQFQEDATVEARDDAIPDDSVGEKENARSVPSKDGKSLLLDLMGQMKGRKIVRDDVRDALIGLENCGGVVVEAVREYLRARENHNGEVPFDAAVGRKSCTVLLNEFVRGELEIGEQVREDARRFALEWKQKLEKLEANVFLKYLQVYGLIDDFKEDEIFKIFQDLLHRNDAPELFRSLGLGNRAADFIKKLISQKKRIEAVNFIYAFELVNEFSPTSIIKEHLDYVKKEAAVTRKSGKTTEASAEAVNLECTGLSAAMNCIKAHNLEAQFPIEALSKRMAQLKKRKSESKKPVSTPQFRTQPQQHSGNKRQSPYQLVHANKQIGNKRHQAAFPKGASQGARLGPPSYSVNLTQQVQEFRAAAARNAPNATVDAPFDRILMPPTYLQPAQPYLPQGINISRGARGSGHASSRNPALSPTNLHQALSSRGIHSSLVPTTNGLSSVLDRPSSIRNPLLQSPTDLHLPRQFLPQYADASQHLLMDSFPASRQRHFMGSIRETEGTSSASGHYRSTGPSAHYRTSPTAHYGDGAATSARLFAQDDLAGIRSDLAAVSAMKYGVVGSSFSHESGSPLVSSAVPRSHRHLHTHDYPPRPSPYSYDQFSSQGQSSRYNP